MAFIKRSTVTPVNIKVGSKMLKCSSCGKPFVSKMPTSLCQNCNSKTSSLNEEFGEEPDSCTEIDLDQE